MSDAVLTRTAPAYPRILGIRISPLNARRIANFRRNRRGWWAMVVFLALFLFSLPAEFIANDRPLAVWYDGAIYMPVLKNYPETAFGGDFETEADYRDPVVQQLIHDKGGWILWPLIEYSYNTVNLNLRVPAPAPPSDQNVLGTDDQGRDVLARLIYGFRLSVLFGFALTVLSSIVGVTAGAAQGYFGGRLDLFFQRFIEIWTSIPALYLLHVVVRVRAEPAVPPRSPPGHAPSPLRTSSRTDPRPPPRRCASEPRARSGSPRPDPWPHGRAESPPRRAPRRVESAPRSPSGSSAPASVR